MGSSPRAPKPALRRVLFAEDRGDRPGRPGTKRGAFRCPPRCIRCGPDPASTCNRGDDADGTADVFQQPVQNAPGEGSVCAAALEGKGDARTSPLRFRHGAKTQQGWTQDDRRANGHAALSMGDGWSVALVIRIPTSPVHSAGETVGISASRGRPRRRRGAGRPVRARR